MNTYSLWLEMDAAWGLQTGRLHLRQHRAPCPINVAHISCMEAIGAAGSRNVLDFTEGLIILFVHLRIV